MHSDHLPKNPADANYITRSGPQNITFLLFRFKSDLDHRQNPTSSPIGCTNIYKRTHTHDTSNTKNLDKLFAFTSTRFRNYEDPNGPSSIITSIID